MTQILSTDPTLSIPAPDPIGRLYRRPGSEPLRQKTDHSGTNSVVIPRTEEIFDKVYSGEWMPSITNVIGVLDKSYLVNWAAKLAAEATIDYIAVNPPERFADIMARRAKAVKYFKLASDRDRDAAAKRGTRIHEACEYLGTGRTLDDLDFNLTADELEVVDSFKAWLDVFQPEFLGNEVTAFGETPSGLRYAGTADFIARINGRVVAGDYKTTRSGLHDEVSLQLTAITRAKHVTLDQETLVDNFPIEAAIGVLLSNDGWQVRQASLSDSKWETFCGARTAWTYSAFHGKTAPQDPALGKFIGRPDQIQF